MNYLIAVDGDEFTGKTTVVVPGLSAFFKSKGYDVLISREPGGSPKGEEMRKRIFKKLREGISPYQQAELFNEARKVHIDEVIQPHLESGDNKIVLLDRYLDSTRVYQGLEGGVEMEKLYELEKKYVGSFFPDISIILYFPEKTLAEIIYQRKPVALEERRKKDEIIPFDKISIEKHMNRNRYYFKDIPLLAEKNHEERHIVTVDVSGSPVEVVSRVVQSVSPLLV